MEQCHAGSPRRPAPARRHRLVRHAFSARASGSPSTAWHPHEVTDILLTHAHYDHAANYLLFPSATVWIGAAELEWAADGASRGSTRCPSCTQPTSPATREPVGSPATANSWTASRHSATRAHAGLAGLPRGGPEGTVLFSGDAAKNRAELVSGDVDIDAWTGRPAGTRCARSSNSGRDRSDTLLVPGHDVPMRWTTTGPRYEAPGTAQIQFVARRRARRHHNAFRPERREKSTDDRRRPRFPPSTCATSPSRHWPRQECRKRTRHVSARCWCWPISSASTPTALRGYRSTSNAAASAVSTSPPKSSWTGSRLRWRRSTPPTESGHWSGQPCPGRGAGRCP